ncbi:molybdopterin molybdenumtransferase MoeA [Pusillimonas sp. TS35]|uniref:molybdopterin molybdotransferase MoeA n=1 Tax=Paracandidimonas lactea TaxID=2895524 RepID=UPI00136BC54E|nr:gephyrin-like molybdotransferase Glp [Paracandidimonas lactea]MYN14918.1 molybdopterin molybdenumtransferase MoeA [Pusillimonas sp. TS35]
MLDFDDAQQRLAAAGGVPTITESCPLSQASGRVLAQTLFATLDLPPADNSAMDGYAIRHADYAPGRALPIQQRCFAGEKPQALVAGQAIRLFTGSLIPEGADTVVMQEDAEEADNAVTLTLAPTLGTHVRRRGEDVAQGKQLLARGTLLRAAELALLASQGYAEVPVFARLKIGLLTTGDELVAPGTPRDEAQIFNSNSPMLAALAAGLGAQVVHTLHAADTASALDDAFQTLLRDCDLILTVGGVSVGEKDLVKPTIEQLGGTLDMWRVRMKPGKPVAFARIQGKPVVCLPGNPVSAFAVFTLLVTPLVRAMQGRADTLPPVGFGTLATSQVFQEKRDDFLRVRAEPRADGLPQLVPYAQQGSGIISALPWASGLARVPAGASTGNGAVLRYYDLAHWLA